MKRVRRLYVAHICNSRNHRIAVQIAEDVEKAGWVAELGCQDSKPGSDILERCRGRVEACQAVLMLFTKHDGMSEKSVPFVSEILAGRWDKKYPIPVLYDARPTEIPLYQQFFARTTKYHEISRRHQRRDRNKLVEFLSNRERRRIRLEVVLGILSVTLTILIAFAFPSFSVFAIVVDDMMRVLTLMLKRNG